MKKDFLSNDIYKETNSGSELMNQKLPSVLAPSPQYNKAKKILYSLTP